MAKKKKDETEAPSPEVVKLAETEEATAAAEAEANADEKEARIASEDRKKEEKATGKSSGKITAVFRRDTFSYEVGDGDREYEEGDEVTFDTQEQYWRWYRRGACETKQDRAVRLKKEVAQSAREIRVLQGG